MEELVYTRDNTMSQAWFETVLSVAPAVGADQSPGCPCLFPSLLKHCTFLPLILRRARNHVLQKSRLVRQKFDGNRLWLIAVMQIWNLVSAEGSPVGGALLSTRNDVIPGPSQVAAYSNGGGRCFGSHQWARPAASQLFLRLVLF